MCAASQQIDVIPNQGHDGIEVGNLGLICTHAWHFFSSQFDRLHAALSDETDQEQSQGTETAFHRLGTHRCTAMSF